MSTTTLAVTATPALRIRAENPNHHLWNNHGTWFLHYTVHPTPFTKARIRRSLGTKDLPVARARRDSFFVHFTGRATLESQAAFHVIREKHAEPTTKVEDMRKEAAA